MSENQHELSFGKLQKKREERLPAKVSFEPVFGSYEFAPTGNGPASPSSQKTVRRRSFLPFDPRRVLAALKSNWRWLVWSACSLAFLGLLVGWLASECKITVTLVTRDLTTTFKVGIGDPYRPGQLGVQTLVDLMTSPELVHRVAAKAAPPISEDALRNSVTTKLGDDKDLVTLTISGRSARALVRLAALYANAAVQMSKDLQVTEISRMNQFYKDRIAAAGEEMARINNELVTFQNESSMIDPETEVQVYTKQLADHLSKMDATRIEQEMTDIQIAAVQSELLRQNPVAQRLEVAKAKLSELLARYTEAHPTVQAQREQIAALERQAAAVNTNSFSAASFAEDSLGGALYMRLIDLQTRRAALEKELQGLDSSRRTLQARVTGISQQGLRYAIIKAKLDAQKNSLSLLANRQREAQLYEANSQGYFRLFAQPRLNDVDTSQRWLNTFSFSFAAFVIGLLVTGVCIAVKEFTDDRLKTVADVERVTGLPVLASLGDVNAMTPADRERWAFRTWTALSGQLNGSPDQGMVCGFISSTGGEGCSTWIRLLGEAAAKRGLRVLTVAAGPTSSNSNRISGDGAAGSEPRGGGESSAQDLQASDVTPQLLVSPAALARETNGAHVPTEAYVPLTDWIWNVERRRQWQGALSQWQTRDNVVVLVELPPASMPQAVLLAEGLPQLIWVADSGRPRARDTKSQLETLRHGKCRLAGAVLNHEPDRVL